MKEITFHEDADAEIVEAAQYYEEKAVALGLSFLNDVETAVEEIRVNPEAFQLVGDEVRHKIVRHFPYSLLYVIEAERIRIIAVAHQKRRPGYWGHRL